MNFCKPVDPFSVPSLLSSQHRESTFVFCVSFLHDSSHGDGIYHGGVPVLDGHFFSHRHRESHVVSGLKIVRCQFVFGQNPTGTQSLDKRSDWKTRDPIRKQL